MGKTLSELWYDACCDMWELIEKRPRLRTTATLWDAFRYLYLKYVPRNGKGRYSSKGVGEE